MGLQSRTDICPAKVVIKIFQESMSEFPSDPESDGWFCSSGSGENEASAYEKLNSLQGREIPWSYMFLKCKLPSGELAYAHVMEFVEGTPGSEFDFSGYERSEVYEVLDAAARTMHLFLEFGVFHNDISSENMILPTSSRTVCFFDFTLAKPPSVKPLFRRLDLGCTLYKLAQKGVRWTHLKDWYDDRIQGGDDWTCVLDLLELGGTRPWLEPVHKLALSEDDPEFIL